MARSLSCFEIHSGNVGEALEHCNRLLAEYEVDEGDVVSLNFFHPEAGEAVQPSNGGPAWPVRVVLVYWRDRLN